MNKLFAGIQVPDKPQEFLPLVDVDFEQDVAYLKQRIAEEIKYDANNLELIFDGHALQNDLKIGAVMRPNGVVHCFQKTKQYEPYKPSMQFNDSEVITRIQGLFTLIAHIQITVTSRVTILLKILNEYPEFRRNLAAQAIIRDSVLFNTIHQAETINKIAEHYPIICEAAPFIVDTIKKELARSALVTVASSSEAANESPNSSEEENSLGANSSSASLAENGTAAQSEISRIRAITRQQLQSALEQIRVVSNTNSVNSLSNIAQRSVDSNVLSGSTGGGSTTSAPLSSSTSGERISSEMFRQHMQRAFSFLASANTTPGTSDTNLGSTNADEVQPMDTTEAITAATTVEDENNDIPSQYRNHEYAEQLRTMAQMGFLNHEENLTFLNLASGNIVNAVNLLMATINE